MKHSPPPTTIYALINPITSEVFYVGATTRLLSLRLSGHLTEARQRLGNKQKGYIIRTILEQGAVPLIQELETCTGYLTAMYSEKFWIRQYEKVFGYSLINKCHNKPPRRINPRYANHYFW